MTTGFLLQAPIPTPPPSPPPAQFTHGRGSLCIWRIGAASQAELGAGNRCPDSRPAYPPPPSNASEKCTGKPNWRSGGCVTSTRPGSNFCGFRYAVRNFSELHRRFSTKTASNSAVFDAIGSRCHTRSCRPRATRPPFPQPCASVRSDSAVASRRPVRRRECPMLRGSHRGQLIYRSGVECARNMRASQSVISSR